jgi:CheY-like chemotaxis protein/anti-sigma regulatory factor (Ser/Thr protein kinase)
VNVDDNRLQLQLALDEPAQIEQIVDQLGFESDVPADHLEHPEQTAVHGSSRWPAEFPLEPGHSENHGCQRRSGLTLEVALVATRSFAMADAARIHQVLWNLLKNAIKFTPAGGRVSIRSFNDGDQLVITCEDTGIGIPDDVLPGLFEPFKQGSADITRHYGGLGLGLALSRSLVVAHGGSLTARSQGAGKGAAFTVMLPTTTAREVDARPLDSQPYRDVAGPRRLNILLVEDHEDTAQTMRESMLAQGHRVRVAGTVAEAVREAAADPCEILISDIGLPDGTGVDLIQQIAPVPRLGAIAMSGFGMESDLIRSRQAGFSRHLTKPVDFALLEQAIADLSVSDPPALHAGHARKNRVASQPRRRRQRGDVSKRP